jgi:hypothetical protein
MSWLILAACGKVVTEQPDGPPGDDARRIDAPADAPPPLGAFVLVTTPDPAIVFNTIAETYRFSNNLANTIWHRQTNKLITGHFSATKYWSFTQGTANFPTDPDQGTQAVIRNRIVYVAATNLVISSTTASQNVTPAPASSFVIGSIDTSGLLTAQQPAVFSDNFTGNCQLVSASATEWLCFDGTVIRRYQTTAGSPLLTAKGTIPFSVALPAGARCDSGSPCFGGTFAFDGAFYYFSAGTNTTNLMYLVYNANGTFVNMFPAAGNGAINAAYFDWSVGRYSTHDGFAGRTGGSAFSVAAPGASDDSQSFSAVSSHHRLDN